MGGFGSGRPRWSGRDTVERHRALDADRLNKAGCLRAGWAGGWQWGDGEQGASINLRAEPDRLHLSYSVRVGGGGWEEVAETVRIVRVPCRRGGTRPYFLCPGVAGGTACGRRVTKLYGAGRRFLCRHCHGLVYASQREDEWARARRRLDRAAQRLGGASGLLAPCPPQPKGMPVPTYARLLDQVLAAELLVAEAGTRRLEQLLAWSDAAERKRARRR
jgi:hypothetical protein